MGPTAPAWMQRFADAVLGTDAKLRLRLKRSLLAVPVYLACALLLWYAVAQGMVDSAAARWLTATTLAGPFVFYGLMRSGAADRLRDPSLTVPQMLFAIGVTLFAYAVTASARSATLLLLALVMNFGVFALKPRQAWGLGAVALGSLAPLSLGLWRADPQRFDGGVEAVNFGIAAAVVPTLAALTTRTHRLRARLRRQRAKLEQALATVDQLAMHDGLTGLVNRRRFQQRLTEEIARQGRGSPGLSLVMIDIDHFKQVNDQHGHAGGDWVLRRFADVAGSAVRIGDVLARWGGEEFMLLLPDTRSAHARVLFERIAVRLRDPGTWSEHPERQISVSAGLAEYRVGDSGATLIDRADGRLYAAKAGGRDRIVWA